MQWTDTVKEYVQAIKSIKPTQEVAQRLYQLIDLTSLNESDTDDTMALLFAKAQSTYGHVAAVCVLPRFVRLAAAQFANKKIKTATVANFPEGEESLEDVLIEINGALEDGAQEVDVVFPYARYLAGEKHYAHDFVAACKDACGNATLKVILETGALGDLAIIADASYEAITAGADFIKTSTGKMIDGATLEAATTMLLVIKHALPQLKRRIGLKVSGGIRDISQAAQYVALADQILGHDYVTPDTFRIGASKLVDEILK